MLLSTKGLRPVVYKFGAGYWVSERQLRLTRTAFWLMALALVFAWASYGLQRYANYRLRESFNGALEVLDLLERPPVILPATSPGVRGVHNTAGLE